MKTTFLSLDQSTTITGWCVWQDGVYKCSGILDHKNERDLRVRVDLMIKDIAALLDRYSPAVVYIEDTAMHSNIKTLKNLTQLQGIIIGFCKARNIDIQIISPSEWRKILGFTQGAGVKRPELKRQCFQWVREHLGIEGTEDEVEAIGIGAAVLRRYENGN